MNEPARNKDAILELLRRVDRGDLTDLECFYHSDYAEHGGSIKSRTAGVSGVREGFAAFLQAFDEPRHVVEDILAEGDRVAVRIRFSGRFARPLFGAAPTGLLVSAEGIAIYRMVEGRIQEKWGRFNAFEHLGIQGSG